MIGIFDYSPKNNKNECWQIKYEVSKDKRYRNYVLLKQLTPLVNVKKTIPFIMLNPGSFHSERSLGDDTTLRIIRGLFLNTGYIIEILNLFNRCQPKKKELSKMSDSERNKNNPIKNRLKKYGGENVIIQWGKVDEFAVKRADEILQFITEQKLKPIGLKDKTGYYYHPIRLAIKKEINRFKKEVVHKI